MSSKTAGKGASKSAGSGGLFYQTYQKLLKQRTRIDRELNKVQSQIFKQLVKGQNTVAYVPRVKGNKVKLADAIRNCMKPNKEMDMDDILEALHKKGQYKTKSTKLYTMVNNKLNRDECVHKPGRGLFVFVPPKGGKKSVKKTSAA
jgi:hypothetical protein